MPNKVVKMVDEKTKESTLCPFSKSRCWSDCALLKKTPQHSYEKYYCGIQQYDQYGTKVLVKDKNE